MEFIFIPGLLCTKEVWGELNQLRNKHICHDANVVDYPSIEQISQNIVANISRDNKKYTLIGISMGGYIAIDLAIAHHPWIKKLILINTTAHSVDKKTLPDRYTSMKLAGEEGIAALGKNYKSECFFNPQQQWLTLEQKMAIDIGTTGYINQQTAIINRKDHFNKLNEINVPTLIISGREDKIIPCEDSVSMFHKIPNSELILLSNCGHLSTIEKKYKISCVVSNFLKC